MLSQDNNIVFLHIPKTAGTSFRKILERRYRPEQIFVSSAARKGLENLRNKSKIERSKIRLVNGHVTFGIHEYLIGPTEYLTFLRDPAERVISFYYYVRRVPHHESHERVSKMNFHEFVTTFGRWDVHNTQITMISGQHEEEKIMLEKSLKNVAQYFSFVGLVEYFEDSLLLLQDTYGLPSKALYSKTYNKTFDRPEVKDLDSKTLTAIQELNAGDYEFYNFMKKQFEDRLSNIKHKEFKALSLSISNKTHEFLSKTKRLLQS